MRPQETYNDQIVRLFLLAAAVWGIVGMAHRRLRRRRDGVARDQFRRAVAEFSRLRPDHTFGVIFAFGGSALMGTCYYIVQRTGPHAARARRARQFHVLGMAARLRPGDGDHAARHHAEQGVRRARVVHRHRGRGRLGLLRRRVLRDDRAAAHPPHLRRQLVLRRVHHRRRPVARRQQHRAAGVADQVLPGLLGRGRRDGAVVVRPQRGRVLPDRGLPRDDVLLRPAPGAAAAVELPLLDRQLLGADLDLHVGGPASPAVHGVARLGAVGRHGVLADPRHAELGLGGERAA